MNIQKKLPGLLLAATMLYTAAAPSVGAVGASTLQITLQPDKQEVTVNGGQKTWEASPVLIGDQVYVPLKLMADTMGIKVQWNAKTKMVEMAVPKVKVQFDIDHNEALLNGVKVGLDTIGVMKDERLMVKLTWLAGIVGAKYTYQSGNAMTLFYTLQPDELVADENENSRPVAKFTFAKPSYKVGEPVKFIDLSYDPDAEGIQTYDWTGKQVYYDTPGTYKISLKVTDSNGHVSKEYSRSLVIENSVYATPLQYKLNYTPEGTAFTSDWSELYSSFLNVPSLTKNVIEDRTRKLILSDSPETIKEKGILYQDTVNGKARLYADHVNGMESKVQFVIMARNVSTSKPVTIKTTNKGEVYPSIYANLIGHEASVDFMLGDPVEGQTLTLQPGQGLTYVRMPDFYPGQGSNVFYDVETDGEVEFSFLALDNDIATPMPSMLSTLKHLPFSGNVRGTFPMSDITWKADMKDIKSPTKLTIGDGKEDPFTKGYDTERKAEVYNEGNYGMIYNIELDNPPKMAILVMGRGGPFKGPFKINGEFALVPNSGVLPAFTSIQVLKRTEGNEGKLNIQFTPPAGSAFPIDLIFYPLDELK